MNETLEALRNTHAELITAAETHMSEAANATAERAEELFAKATELVDKAEDLEGRIATATRAARARDNIDRHERASAPRPAVSGPAVTRSAIKDMTDEEVAMRSELLSSKLAVHERSFTDEEQALVDRTPRAEQLWGLRMLAAGENSPWKEAWRRVSEEDKEAVRAYTGGQLTTPAADGGNLIPKAWYSEIVSERQAVGPMFSNEVINLTTKEAGTGNLVVAYESDTKAWELVATAEAADPASQKAGFSQKEIAVSKYSRRTPISFELVQDNPFSIRAWITGKIGDAVARGANKLFTDAAGTPPALQGIVPGVTAVKTAAANNKFLVNEALDAVGMINEAYLASPRARFMVNRAVAIEMRKETSATAIRAWSDQDMRAGVPAMLHGFPVLYNGALSGLAAGQTVGVFGDMGQYWGVVDGTPRVYSRYDDDGDQYLVTLFIRLGGRVIDPTGLVKLTLKS